jgi:hypothetical protein
MVDLESYSKELLDDVVFKKLLLKNYNDLIDSCFFYKKRFKNAKKEGNVEWSSVTEEDYVYYQGMLKHFQAVATYFLDGSDFQEYLEQANERINSIQE